MNWIKFIVVRILGTLIILCSLYLIVSHFLTIVPIGANLTGISLQNPILLKLQQKYYKEGMRSIIQGDAGCTEADLVLAYKAKIGDCYFNNFEFSTLLKFSNDGAITKTNSTNGINLTVVGDSHAMGWGVSYNETFAYLLSEKGYSVKNYAVSSYGTEQEILSAINSSSFASVDYLIIQYCDNDLGVNKRLINEYRNKIYKGQAALKPKILTLGDKIRNASRLYLSEYSFIKAIKLPVTVFMGGNEELKVNQSGYLHKKYFLNVLRRYPILKDKKIIVFYSNGRGRRFGLWESDEPKHDFSNLRWVDLKLKPDDYYNIDDHLNVEGHANIAMRLNSIIQQLEK